MDNEINKLIALQMANHTDLFLSHDWGPCQKHHVKVRIINDILVLRGYLTWFDDQEAYRSKSTTSA